MRIERAWTDIDGPRVRQEHPVATQLCVGALRDLLALVNGLKRDS